jgi:hypothetical protein
MTDWNPGMSDEEWHQQVIEEQRRLDSHRPMLEYLRSIWKPKTNYARMVEKAIQKDEDLF